MRHKYFLGAYSFKIARYESEDVSKSVDNYEDNEFDESSDEEVGLNVVTDDSTSDDLYSTNKMKWGEQPIFCLVPRERVSRH